MKKFILICLASCSISARANRIQAWTQENVSYGIGVGTTASLSQENRIGINEWQDGKKHLDEIHVAPALDYSIYGWLSVGINYRHVLLRDGSDARYVHDRRPGIDISLRHKTGNLSLLNRSRFICRIPEGEHAYFRYRNLSKVSYSLGKISPFASYEWYYDEGSGDREYRKNDRFSQQWLSFGFDFKISRSFKATAYYMLTENKNRTTHDWYPGHVVGISISMEF